ncbi:RICIN domain-containing protein [Ruminococcus sp.]
MSKHIKKSLSVFLSAVILIGIFVVMPISASAITQSEFDNKLNFLRSQYPNYSTWYGSFDGGSQCYGFARLVGYNVFGSYPSSWSRVYSISNVKKGDILQYGNTSGNGHTVFVTNVSGDTITFVDCNGNGNYSGSSYVRSCGIKWDNTINKYSNMFGKYGFSYLLSSPDITNPVDKPTDNYVDIGTDFFALIMNKAMWKPLTVEQNKNVDIKCGKYYDCPDQIWKFERQSDSSYKIISASNQDCLDVDGASTSPGANVQAFVDHGHDAQRWYVIERNGGVVLKSKISNCVLEVNGGNATDGTNVQMNIENDSDAQIFSIYKVDSNSFALNIGNDFTAPIFNLYHWLPIENDENNNVVIGHENGTANQVWRFLRQTDGSYKIVSCLDGKCLDVQGASYEGGANVQVFTDHSHDAQRWYIFSYNGGYMLQSKLSGLFLDLYQCIPDEGNNIDLWSRNYSESQIFSIYNGEECKLSSPVLNVNVDSKNIKFSWNNVYGENYYNLRIWNEKHWENDSYLNLWNIPANKTETDIQLPAGNFEAYVDTGNYYDVRMSNVVSFTVKPKINTRIMNNKSVVFNWDEVLKAKSYNLEIINKSNNGVISKNNLTENSFIIFLDSGKYSVRIISDNNVVSDSMDFEIEYKDQLIGDVNRDGKISVNDVTELQMYISQSKDFSDEQKMLADYNQDGVIDVLDVTDIQQLIANS